MLPEPTQTLTLNNQDVMSTQRRCGNAAASRPRESCEYCNIRSWNAKPIILKAAPINGLVDYTAEQNLVYLCPNCESTLCSPPFYTPIGEYNITEALLTHALKTRSIEDVKALLEATHPRNIDNFHKRNGTTSECMTCGVKISRRAKRCVNCSRSKGYFTQEDYNLYIRKKEDNMTAKQIAAQVFGISYTTLYRRIKKFLEENSQEEGSGNNTESDSDDDGVVDLGGGSS